MIKRTVVMLIFGGESSEHVISISSARNVYAALDETKFDVILGYIDKSGRWWLLESFDRVNDIEGEMEIIPVLGSKSFETLPITDPIQPDAILPVLHGENGEDGTIQGLARLLHIPIVGCGVAASAICIDKVLTKQLLEKNGIKTTPYVVHISGDILPNYSQLSVDMGEKMFIKPAGCGSSVGVSKISNSQEFEGAMIEAHRYDRKVLIEKAINARELEVGILGSGKNAKSSCVGEIKPDSEFYNFDSKYASGNQSKVVIPAEIDDKLSSKIRETALNAYSILGCTGLSRIDFFLSNEGELYLNEINTFPGFTNISMYPKLWQKEGLSYGNLIEALIKDAINR